MARFSIILADPCWSYRDPILHSGKGGAATQYPTMTDDDIADLPVPFLAADSCALFLWCTMPKLAEGLEVIRRWGFLYKTCAFTWVKRNQCGTFFMGMGNWTRGNAEVCLLGIKGKPSRVNAGVHSVVDTVRGRHSAKPSCVRDRIVQLLGPLPRVELFARERSPGWVSLGNDLDGQDLRDSVPALIDQVSVETMIMGEAKGHAGHPI